MRNISKPMILSALMITLSGISIGCATDPSSETANIGEVRLPLETVNGEFTYRLANAQFQVTGPESMTVSTVPEDEFLLLSLEPGQYSVTLLPGWQLQRIDAQGATVTMTEAVLTSQNPITVDVTAQLITELYFAFDVSGMGIEFGDGGLKIGITVCDDPAGCSDSGDGDGTGGDGDGDGDGSNPLLSSAAALGALCPGGTVSLGGEGIDVYAQIRGGQQQGDYDGEVVTPIAGSTRVLGTCNSFSRATSGGGAAGRLNPSPWYFFLPVDASLIYLSSAWNRGERIQNLTFHYFEDGADGTETETQTVDLEQASVWGIERIVVPDPADPSATLDFVRVEVGYQTMNWESSESATVVQLEGPLASVPFETPECSASEDAMYRYFMTADDAATGVIEGDATFVGEEGTVEVFGVCHSSFRPVTGGLSSGRPVMQPLTVVKKSDSATALFLQTLSTNGRSRVSIRGYRALASGEYEHAVTYELDNARLTGLEQGTTDGSAFERLEYTFQDFSLIWEIGPQWEYNYTTTLL